jgi:hypothetical protein
MRLAESAYHQFRSEPSAGTSVGADWHGVLIAAHQVLLGAHWLPRFDLPASALPPGAVERARADARAAAGATDRLAALCAGERPPPDATRPGPAQPLAPPLPALVDLEVWLTSLTAQLARVEAGLPDVMDGAAAEATGGASDGVSGVGEVAAAGRGGRRRARRRDRQGSRNR